MGFLVRLKTPFGKKPVHFYPKGLENRCCQAVRCYEILQSMFLQTNRGYLKLMIGHFPRTPASAIDETRSMRYVRLVSLDVLALCQKFQEVWGGVARNQQKM